MNSFVRYVILAAVALTAVSLFSDGQPRASDRPAASVLERLIGTD